MKAPDDKIHKSLIDNLYDGVYFVDTNRCITYWNKGAERITGYKAETIVGTFCNKNNQLDHITNEGVHICENGCPLVATMKDGQHHEAEVLLNHADGFRLPVLVRTSPIRDEEGQIIGAVEVFSDNQSMFKIRRKVDELEHNILLDSLTGVGNRLYSEIKIKTAIAEYSQHKLKFGLLFLDIDNFKSVNDTYGHNAGDKALQNAAKSLFHSLRPTDTCGRWGGEEFVVLLQNVNEKDLMKVSEKLRSMIESSHFQVGDRDLNITISIGATLVKENDTHETIVERADSLMYQSKINGRNQVTIDGVKNKYIKRTGQALGSTKKSKRKATVRKAKA